MFRGLMREAREWGWKLLEAGRERDDRRALGIAHAALGMFDLVARDFHEAVRHSDECMRTAATPYERRISAITKASAEILLGNVEHGLASLLEAIGVASETGWGLIVDYGTNFVGVGHVLAGRFDKGIRLLESAIAAFDARGHIAYATVTRILLAEIYLEMLTSRATPALSVILRNIRVILRIKFSGTRHVEVLLEQAGRVPHLDERGTIRARVDTNMGLLHKIKKQPLLARQFLEKARAPAELQGATSLVAKIDAVLAEL